MKQAGRPPSPATASRRKQVLEMSDRGLTPTEIADALKASPAVVCADRHRLGVSQPRPLRRRSTLEPDEVAKMSLLVDDECPISEIARTFDLSPSTVRRYFPNVKRMDGRVLNTQEVDAANQLGLAVI